MTPSNPANGTWCSLSESRVSIIDTRLHCQMLLPNRTICKIPNFGELLGSERVATQLKVLCKQHMLDVWSVELVCSTQSARNCIEHRSPISHLPVQKSTKKQKNESLSNLKYDYLFPYNYFFYSFFIVFFYYSFLLDVCKGNQYVSCIWMKRSNQNISLIIRLGIL